MQKISKFVNEMWPKKFEMWVSDECKQKLKNFKVLITVTSNQYNVKWNDNEHSILKQCC